MTPKRLAIAGASLLVVAIVLAIVLHKSSPQTAPPPPTTTTTAPPPTTTAPPPTTTAPPPAPPPPKIAMSWENAGAIIVHTHDADPTLLGQELRSAGFGWAAIFLGSNGNVEPIDPEWVLRFVLASGLPVGGWTTLGTNPQADASFAVGLLKQNGLSFYIADAEATDPGQPRRSQAFVDAFRAAEPTMPAALSSLCDAQGVGLQPWASAGFAFLPQAYVNDFGTNVAPAVCVSTASPFPASEVHPTVGSYHGQKGWVSVQRYIRLLHEAGTTGFSVYPAETQMTEQDWQAYGNAIRTLHIANWAG
jgi:hypothetical protein